VSAKRRSSRGGKSSAAKRTAHFIVALSQHPELKEAWKKDPERAMQAAGLSEEGKAALRSRDPETIWKHLGDDAPPGCFVILFLGTHQ